MGRTNYLRVNRYIPSSKSCNGCGFVHESTPELFGNPVTLTHTKLKNILPDKPEKKLYELAVRLELMDSEDAVSLLVALSRNYQTGTTKKLLSMTL